MSLHGFWGVPIAGVLILDQKEVDRKMEVKSWVVVWWTRIVFVIASTILSFSGFGQVDSEDLEPAKGMGLRTSSGWLSVPPLKDQLDRGIKAGEFLFAPILSVEGRYNSNLFREDSREGQTKSWILSVQPGFRLLNPNPSNVALKWRGIAGINFYFSEDPNAKKQGRFSAQSDLNIEFLPKSVFGFFILDSFVREIQPRNYSTSKTYDRNYNHAEAGISIKPGGGALIFKLSYAFNIDLFDEFKTGNLYFHEARFQTFWDFLPKTTVFLDVNWRKHMWSYPEQGYRDNSMPLRIWAGIQGFITKRIGMTLKAGFGKGFYENGSDVTTFIGEAGIGFKPFETTVMDLRYRRDFSDSFYAQWYLEDGAQLTFTQQVARRVNIKASGKYSYIAYNEFTPQGAVASQLRRRDHALQGLLGIEVSLFRMMSVNLGYQFDAIITDFRLDYVNAYGVPRTDYGGYNIHQGFGSISLLY